MTNLCRGYVCCMHALLCVRQTERNLNNYKFAHLLYDRKFPCVCVSGVKKLNDQNKDTEYNSYPLKIIGRNDFLETTFIQTENIFKLCQGL